MKNRYSPAEFSAGSNSVMVSGEDYYMKIEVLGFIGDGLAKLAIEAPVIIRGKQETRINRQIWQRTAKRGAGKMCIFCGKDLTGVNSYRPSGNPWNRGWRLCIDHVKANAVLEIDDGAAVGIGREGLETGAGEEKDVES